MTQVLAIIFLVLFVWVAVPHIARGEWLAPTAMPYDHWAHAYAIPGSREMLATPPEGYGWFRFDFWNNPPATGRSVQKGDFALRR